MSLKMTKIGEILEELLRQELRAGLYVIATDIGNPGDISLRALAILSKVDLIICEERKVGLTFLKKYGIEKPLELLNEHNEVKQSKILLEKLLTKKMTAALISDNGTPLFADPGSKLVYQCHYYQIPVFSVPGASSIMAALMIAGRKKQSFHYYGFLPANKEERIIELKKLKREADVDYLFLEAPYRLEAFLRDMQMILGKERQGIIAYKLTHPEEKLFTGTLQELQTMIEELPK
ncbi:MAG: 16S rRNA (cytidine(1402)-2'-O)-methyltransferase, partial [Candidatus Cloacimonetes bacterium]|nr:16S rRNA (cytidine(1402)-2'-O)-methyltransferase [Candidatus Cloacimonadota bacterium]